MACFDDDLQCFLPQSRGAPDECSQSCTVPSFPTYVCGPEPQSVHAGPSLVWFPDVLPALLKSNCGWVILASSFLLHLCMHPWSYMVAGLLVSVIVAVGIVGRTLLTSESICSESCSWLGGYLEFGHTHFFHRSRNICHFRRRGII